MDIYTDHPYVTGKNDKPKISKFTGGLISPGTMKNLDSLGRSPKIKILSGRKVAYTDVGQILSKQ